MAHTIPVAERKDELLKHTAPRLFFSMQTKQAAHFINKGADSETARSRSSSSRKQQQQQQHQQELQTQTSPLVSDVNRDPSQQQQQEHEEQQWMQSNNSLRASTKQLFGEMRQAIYY